MQRYRASAERLPGRDRKCITAHHTPPHRGHDHGRAPARAGIPGSGAACDGRAGRLSVQMGAGGRLAVAAAVEVAIGLGVWRWFPASNSAERPALASIKFDALASRPMRSGEPTARDVDGPAPSTQHSADAETAALRRPPATAVEGAATRRPPPPSAGPCPAARGRGERSALGGARGRALTGPPAMASCAQMGSARTAQMTARAFGGGVPGACGVRLSRGYWLMCPHRDTSPRAQWTLRSLLR